MGTKISKCARCGEDHEVEFAKLKEPFKTGQTHWATCPVTGEPIAMRIMGETDQDQESMDGSPSLINEEHITIKFQCGPVKEFGDNGTTIEHILELLINRLEGFQKGPFKCEENDKALTHLDAAKEALEERTRDRQARGVEGQNIA
jgi:hypothetical protein